MKTQFPMSWTKIIQGLGPNPIQKLCMNNKDYLKKKTDQVSFIFDKGKSLVH